MQCQCGAHYHPDHGCGMAVDCGTSFAEHIIARHWGEGGFFGASKNYQPWESPANVGMCPWCWHKVADLDKPFTLTDVLNFITRIKKELKTIFKEQ